MKGLGTFERIVVIGGLAVLAVAIVAIAFANITQRGASTAPVQPEAEQAVQADPAEAAREALDEKVGGGVFYGKVKGDKTGSWRSYVYYSADQAQDIAAEYHRAYFDDDGEVHALVNLGLKTTARVTYGGGQLFVDVFEYVDGEEHNAVAMFTGMPLVSYVVDAETGAVEKV